MYPKSAIGSFPLWWRRIIEFGSFCSTFIRRAWVVHILQSWNGRTANDRTALASTTVFHKSIFDQLESRRFCELCCCVRQIFWFLWSKPIRVFLKALKNLVQNLIKVANLSKNIPKGIKLAKTSTGSLLFEKCFNCDIPVHNKGNFVHQCIQMQSKLL